MVTLNSKGTIRMPQVTSQIALVKHHRKFLTTHPLLGIITTQTLSYKEES